MDETPWRCPTCGFAQPRPIAKLRVATLAFYDDARFPGRCVLVLDAHATLVEDLPLETARDVIKVGYMSAQAQLCELWDDQAANYDALMAIEQAKKKWTDQQLLYITTLHRMTIHMAAGKLKVVEKGPEEIQVTLEPIETTKDSCNEERKKKIKDTVLAYVKASPLGQNIKPLPPGGAPPPAAASAAPAAPAAQPVPAAQKK